LTDHERGIELMKKPSDLAILAIGIYVFHQIVLSVVLLDYYSFVDSLKWFSPIGALQSGVEGTEKFFFVLEGIVNLAMVGVMVFLIVSRGKQSGPTSNTSITSFGTPVSHPRQD